MGIEFNAGGGNDVTLTEPDGVPNISPVTEIQVTNGSLTQLAAGVGLVNTDGLFSEDLPTRNIFGGNGTNNAAPGTDCFFAGSFAGSQINASDNIAIGTNALQLGTGATCIENIAIGTSALAATPAQQNVAIGTRAATVANGSRGCTYLGNFAATNTVAPRDSIFIGHQVNGAGSGSQQHGIYIGAEAGFFDAIVGEANICIGYQAMRSNISRRSCIAIGNTAATGLLNGAAGNGCIIMGMDSMAAADTAEGMVVIGNSASGGANTQADSVIIGIGAAAQTESTDAVIIGAAAFGGIGTATGGARSVIIGNSAANQAILGAGGSDCIIIGNGVLLPAALTNRYISIGDMFRGQINTNDVFLKCPDNDPTATPLNNNECSFFVSGGIFQVRYTDNAGVSVTFNLS